MAGHHNVHSAACLGPPGRLQLLPTLVNKKCNLGAQIFGREEAVTTPVLERLILFDSNVPNSHGSELVELFVVV